MNLAILPPKFVTHLFTFIYHIYTLLITYININVYTFTQLSMIYAHKRIVQLNIHIYLLDTNIIIIYSHVLGVEQLKQIPKKSC